MNPKLLLLATTTTAAAYLQGGRPVVRLDRPKWDTIDLDETEQLHEMTQPPLSEKALWERALERQEWDTPQQQQQPASSPLDAAAPTKRELRRQRRAKKRTQRSPWERLAELAAVGEITRGKILSVNRGGAMYLVHGLRAFLPNSHRGDRPAIVGRELPVKVLSADIAARRIVVSHREAARATLRRGDIVHGTVASLRPYGALVAFGGGLRGLLHRRSISAHDWKLVRDVDDVDGGYVVDACFRDADETRDAILAVGSAVTCLVTGHDRERRRIGLSTRALETVPGDMLRDPRAVFEGAEGAVAARRERRALELLEYRILAEVCDELQEGLLEDLLP